MRRNVLTDRVRRISGDVRRQRDIAVTSQRRLSVTS